LIKSLVHHLLIFIKFTILKSDFHQVHHSNFQMQLFEILHTDGKFFLYVNQFIRKRHSSLIVDIIESSASVESDQIRSNQIRSNQIRSNQIKSDQACLHRLVIFWERQSRCVLYEETSIRSSWLSLRSVFVRCKEWDSIERILTRWSRSFWL
jgi:hypothetical protein